MFEVTATDRVLFLAPPPAAQVAALAARMERGLAVAFAFDDANLVELRRALLDCVNVMVLPPFDGEIPWDDAFFTVVVEGAPAGDPALPATAEMARVLVIGGRLLRHRSLVEAAEPSPDWFAAEPEPAGEFHVYRRIG